MGCGTSHHADVKPLVASHPSGREKGEKQKAMEVQEEALIKSDANLERELDNRTYALQRDLLVLRLARMHGLPHEEKRKRCLEQLRHLGDLLTEIEASLRDQQEEVIAM
jgi:hypothetical protein